MAHDLDHRTLPSGLPIELFDSHGAGVAAGDLDGDGDLDLVLTNLAGPVSLLWNEGGLRFRRQIVPIRHTRAVTVVDADGDGLLDIAFTRGNGPAELWRRDTLDGEFDRLFEPAPSETAYTMAWGDLDGDGDLDLVTATYDAELVKNLGFGHGAGGVFYHERAGRSLRTTRLADRAEALALLLVDLDGDGRLDIHVGNDFALIDQVWLRTGSGWAEAMPFRAISRNTMSLDAGDVDGDGEEELFAADMSPYSLDLARHYLTVMMKMAEVPGEQSRSAGDRQRAPVAGGGRKVPQQRAHGRRGLQWMELVGQARGSGSRRRARPLRGQRHGRQRTVSVSAGRRADRGEPGVPERR